MDLHDHFKAYLREHSLLPEDIEVIAQKTIQPETTRRILQTQVETVRVAWYSGAQAVQTLFVENLNDPKVKPEAVSTAMMRLQRQTVEGLGS